MSYRIGLVDDNLLVYPKVSIIILNWNGKEDTIECIESLKHISYPNYDILLVDNGSTDGSVEYFKEQYPEMEIIENRENLGFTKGNNIAIKKTIANNTDYILLLNNDVAVEPDFLDKMVCEANQNDKIGIIGPKINYYGTPYQIWAAGGHINYWICLIAYYGMNKPDAQKYSYEKDVDFVSGCAMLIKVSVCREIGLLDERYFAYFEDVDFCLRAKNNGYTIRYVPSAKIYHKVSKTSGGALSPFSLYLSTRNKLLFSKIHLSKLQLLTSLPVTMVVLNLRILYILITKRDVKACRMIVKGIKDALIGRFGL